MAKATKIIVIFDDGTSYDFAADSAASIFLKESAAVHCGHKPPYGKPPRKEESGAMLTAMSTATGGSGTVNAAGTEGTSCYMINGVIICT